MARNHFIQPTAPKPTPMTVRLGAGNTPSDNYDLEAERGKLVKFSGESAYVLCVAGDPIEGYISSIEPATQNGWSIGGVVDKDEIYALADGLEATPGTGTIAIGDYVVAGAITAKGTALASFPKVCKATNQPGATVTSADNVVGNLNAAIAKVTDAQLNAVYAWRVVSLGSAGTGAVGTTIVIKRMNA